MAQSRGRPETGFVFNKRVSNLFSSISDDEMFSDIYKIKETHEGIFFEVEGKVS